MISFAGERNPTWAGLDAEVVANLGEDIPLTVDRNGQIINLKLRPRLETRGNETFGVIDIQPPRTYIGVAEVQGYAG